MNNPLSLLYNWICEIDLINAIYMIMQGVMNSYVYAMHCLLLHISMMMWILTLLLEWCSMRHRSGTEDSGSGALHEDNGEA